MELCVYCEGEVPVMECYDHCQENVSGEHEADGKSFHLEIDGGAVYLDVNCLHCGQGGCIGRFDTSEVTWG